MQFVRKLSLALAGALGIAPAMLAAEPTVEVSGYACRPDPSSQSTDGWYAQFQALGKMPLKVSDDALASRLLALMGDVYCAPVEMAGRFDRTTSGETFTAQRIVSEKPAADGSVFLVSRIARYQVGDELYTAQAKFEKGLEEDGRTKVHFVNVSDGLSGVVAVVTSAYNESELTKKLETLRGATNHEGEPFVIKRLAWSRFERSGDFQLQQ